MPLPTQLLALESERQTDFLSRPNAKPWHDTLHTIRQQFPQTPSGTPDIQIQNGIICAGTALDPNQKTELKQQLMRLKPWRKGPYQIAGVDIDAEWHCQLKWKRLCAGLDIDNLVRDKTVLDIGCSSGYFMVRMHEHGPKEVIGVDTSVLYYYQFNVLNHFMQLPNISYHLLGQEHLSGQGTIADTIFHMGVLYHRRDPIEALVQMRDILHPGGTMILETLIIPGDTDDELPIPDRYAGMINLYTLPSLRRLHRWIEQAGFDSATTISAAHTTIDEQRITEWTAPVSLADALDPDKPQQTIEGHPAPYRAILLLKKA